jgi:flagellar biosynthesis chaperone FliJ
MSGARTKPYRDPLQALHTKQSWTVDALAAEMAHANAAVQTHERTVAQVVARIMAVLTQITQVRSSAKGLDIVLDQRLQAYLAQLETERDQARKSLDEAKSLRDTVLDQLVRARRLLDGYERRREQGRAEHAHEAALATIKQADDDWLLRQPVTGEIDDRV